MGVVEEAFRKWDITGDGNISNYELHAALTQLGMSESQVDQCFKAADVSKDGILQYEEFLDWVFRDPAVVQQYCLKSAKEGLHVVTVDSCLDFWKKFPEPEGNIEKVFFAAMVILNEDRDLSWTGVKQILKKPHDFLEKLHNHDPRSASMSEAKMKKLKYFTGKDFFSQDNFKSHHTIVQALCNWALAIASLELKAHKKHWTSEKSRNFDAECWCTEMYIDRVKPVCFCSTQCQRHWSLQFTPTFDSENDVYRYLFWQWMVYAV